MWLFRELVTYWVFMQALWDRKIHWAVGSFDLKFGGQAMFIDKDASKQP